MQKTFCRYAPSLGALEGTPLQVWGTPEYNEKKHKYEPCVFFGLYGLPDFYSLWRHKGRKYILWAGSDILHFREGYWLDDDGEISLESMGGVKLGLSPRGMAKWINKYCESYVEDEGEAWQLNDCGIEVKGIIPSFMGNINNYKVSFKKGNKVYLSANEGYQHEYGWGIIAQIACQLPEIEFHMYGAEWKYQSLPNVIVHGRVSKGVMNDEIKNMQCGLRLNKHDGFSEITAKSVLWGQYPITYLYHPMIKQYTSDDCGQPFCNKGLNNLVKLLKEIPKKKKPNLKVRSHYLGILNQYPWNANNKST